MLISFNFKKKFLDLGFSQNQNFRVTIIWDKEWEESSEGKIQSFLMNPFLKNVTNIPIENIRIISRCTGSLLFINFLLNFLFHFDA